MNSSSAVLPVVLGLMWNVLPSLGSDVQLPNSPAGKIADAWIKLFTEDSKAAEDAFEKEYGIPVELRFSDVKLERVLEESDHTLSILVTALPANEKHIVDFELRPDSSGKLIGLAMRGPVETTQLEAANAPLDAKRRERTVQAVAQTLRDNYVFPETGEKLATTLEDNLAAGRYNDITQPAQLARMMTDDLMAVAHDKHLRVRRRLPIVKGAVPTEEQQRERARASNHGFVKAEVLPGNIGYIKFNGFSARDEAEEAAAAALSFVERCDALIFDVRDNGGGSPRMIEYLCSHLFPPDTHLNSFKDRNGSETGRTTTHDRIKGKRFPDDMPVYVLTSAYTFSAAEEFTYNLQQTKRATIVGETTGGGAHPVTMQPVNRQFEVSVPYQRAENPISKTNWEGTGIVPEIKVSTAEALDAAYNAALRRVGDRDRSATAETPAVLPAAQQ